MKSFEIHIDAVNMAATNMILIIQQPSWNRAAIFVRDIIISKITAWNNIRAKLILTIDEAPKQAELPPDASGQFSISLGNQSTSFLAENMRPSEMPIHKT